MLTVVGWLPLAEATSITSHQTCREVTMQLNIQHKLNLEEANALGAVCPIPQALFTDGFI